MPAPLTVTCLVDEATVASDDPGFRHMPDKPNAEYCVVDALRALGHEVHIVAATDDVEALVRELLDRRPDVVFNLTELFRWDRRLDANVAGLLEMIDVPFTGTGPVGLMLARNKALSKHILRSRRIRVPGFTVLYPGKRARIPRALRYPMVVKPLMADGSDGISNASLVHAHDELLQRAAHVHQRFNQPAIAEEYIDGREVYVGITGTARLHVLPPRELFFGRADEGGPVLATYKLKWDDTYQQRWRIRFGHGEMEPALARRVHALCKRAYRTLQLRDYGRIDLRITDDHQVYVIEVNPNPNLAHDDELAQAGDRAGIPYTTLIAGILRHARRRKARG